MEILEYCIDVKLYLRWPLYLGLESRTSIDYHCKMIFFFNFCRVYCLVSRGRIELVNIFKTNVPRLKYHELYYYVVTFTYTYPYKDYST